VRQKFVPRNQSEPLSTTTTIPKISFSLFFLFFPISCWQRPSLLSLTPTFRQQTQGLLRGSQEAEAPPHDLEQAGSERNVHDNGEQPGVEADAVALVQPDHLDRQHDYHPSADDNELDMDWQPTDRDCDSTNIQS
jgi:hypothetical protein